MKGAIHLLLLTLIIISCSERYDAKQHQEKTEPDLSTDVLELPDGYGRHLAEIAQVSGFSPDDMMSYVLSCSLDMGSHNWIYKYDKTGQFSYAILLRSSDHDHSIPRAEVRERRLEAFRETIVDGKLHRTHLAWTEAIRELELIEEYLIEFLGAKTYRFYYEGGIPEESKEDDNVEGAPSTDPFAKEVKPMSQQERHDLANHLNHQVAYQIVRLIHEFRRTEEVEQVGADQPTTARELKSEGKDKPQPESKDAPR
jgi:hypothetical protein